MSVPKRCLTRAGCARSARPATTWPPRGARPCRPARAWPRLPGARRVRRRALAGRPGRRRWRRRGPNCAAEETITPRAYALRRAAEGYAAAGHCSTSGGAREALARLAEADGPRLGRFREGVPATLPACTPNTHIQASRAVAAALAQLCLVYFLELPDAAIVRLALSSIHLALARRLRRQHRLRTPTCCRSARCCCSVGGREIRWGAGGSCSPASPSSRSLPWRADSRPRARR